jgi:adenine-specific DNA-methyltransferase
LFEAQDQVDRQREELIADIEGKMQSKDLVQPLFSMKWKLG